MRAATRTVGLLVSGLAVGILAIGCGDDDDPSPAPSPSISGSTETATDDPTDDPTQSTSGPTTSPEPTVAPATGPLLEEEISQVNAPAGEWEPIPDVVDYASAVGNASSEVVSLSDRENFAQPTSIDEQVKAHNRTLPEGAIVERQPDIQLDGAPGYYVIWYEKGDTLLQHDISVDHEGRVVAVQLTLRRDDSAATAAVVASVLASFRWR